MTAVSTKPNTAVIVGPNDVQYMVPEGLVQILAITGDGQETVIAQPSPDILVTEVVLDEVVQIGQMGPQGPKGTPGTGAMFAFTLVAGQPLGSPRVVCVRNGQAFLPDLNDYTDVAAIVGVTLSAVAGGEEVEIAPTCEFQENLWNWVPGTIWCGADGVLTQVRPTSGALVEVGRAADVDRVVINIRPGILLEDI